MMIKPTVGRVLWFYKAVPGQGHKGPLAAIVAKVHTDSCVALCAFDEGGRARSEPSVRLVQEGEKCPTFDYCAWMPYQLGQAAKTEAAEKAAKS